MPKAETEDDGLSGQDVYLKYTEKSGKSHVDQHRVWDIDAFYRAQLSAAAAVGGGIAPATEADYRRERWASKSSTNSSARSSK